ncbi:MAG: peptidoglycan-binding domain-containing protein [Cyanobacteria bacterium J06628_6]
MTDSLIHHAEHYRGLVTEYCQLSCANRLSDRDADRIGDILSQAVDDPMLSLLVDEADHMLNHLRHLIDETDVIQQQTQLKASIDSCWVEQVLLDASARLQKPQSETLQSYLKDKGLYVGAIDGVVGPETQAAIKHCSDLQASMAPPDPINLPDLQEC